MKILYANSYYAPHIGGGAEVILRALAEGMANRGHQVSVLTTAETNGDEIIENVHVHRLTPRNLYWSFSKEQTPAWKRSLWHSIDSNNLFLAKPISLAMEKTRPDVVVSHNLSGLSIVVWKTAQQLGIPVVHVMHDYYLICPRTTMIKGQDLCEKACLSCQPFRRSHSFLSNNVTAAVGVSQSILETHLRAGLFVKSPIKKVIHNARNLPHAPTREPLTKQNRSLIFGFIGRLAELKGIQNLIKAFSAAAEEAPGITLLVAGSGSTSYENELKKSAPPGIITFLGTVNALDFFKKIDVCIVPSIWQDPLPGVVYEALSQGVPVIGARRGGIPEMIQDGINGVLFDPSQPHALKEIIVRMANNVNEVDALQTRAVASSARYVNFERMLNEHESLYEQALRYHLTPTLAD